MTVCHIKPVINDIWEYKKTPQWNTKWDDDEGGDDVEEKK